jgi:hypothetical protein
VRLTNKSHVDLGLAIWLGYDDYDYQTVPEGKKYISVTTLMKPVRQIILPQRIPPEQRELDVTDFIANSMGHAIHDSVEKAWLKGYARVLRQLGYPQSVIDRVRINPTDDEVRANPDIIAVYLEQRAYREIDGYIIGGKFDMVTEGIIKDTKSTSTYNWVKGTRDEEHREQMSLYRWIDAGQPLPKITEDHGRVNYIFTDWQKFMARSNPNYPDSRIKHKDIVLMDLDTTEQWIRRKLADIEAYKNKAEADIPECTDEELWRSEPQYRYFSDPNKAKDPNARSTKNFDDLVEARKFMAEKGGVGTIVTKLGEVKRCGYCPAFDACSQKDRYVS